MKKNILVVCGGISGEHPISINSAKNIIDNIDTDIFNIHIAGITKAGKWQYYSTSDFYTSVNNKISSYSLKPSKQYLTFKFGFPNPIYIESSSQSTPLNIDIIFPIVHGTGGEDGILQGTLESLNIPYVGTNTLSSAMGMEKDITKILAEKNNIPTAKWELVNKPTSTTKLKMPVFVKPVNSGSSLGIHKVTYSKELATAIKDALIYSDSVLIEEAVESPRELEIAVLGNYKYENNIVVSRAGEIVVQNGFYDFKEKYDDTSSAKLNIPANIKDTELKTLQEYAKTIFIALKAKGMARIDFLLSKTGKIFFNEVNTHPGFTQISMYPSLMNDSGISYDKLLQRLIDIAMQ